MRNAIRPLTWPKRDCGVWITFGPNSVTHRALDLEQDRIEILAVEAGRDDAPGIEAGRLSYCDLLVVFGADLDILDDQVAQTPVEADRERVDRDDAGRIENLGLDDALRRAPGCSDAP